MLHLRILCLKELEETGHKKKDPTRTAIAQALSEAATAIVCALTGSAKTTPGHGAIITSSPANLIDSRSKLYKQLSEHQNLRSTGILTDAEYATEKETIMSLLKELKSRQLSDSKLYYVIRHYYMM